MFVKLAACAREKVQIGAALAGDGLHAGVWSTPPTPVLRAGGRVLLCTLTDLPREIELPSVVLLGTYKPENDGECVFIVVHGSSKATHPVDVDDKTWSKGPRSRDGETLDVALGEGGARSVYSAMTASGICVNRIN